MQILDLGTGAGHFPFIAQYYGHSVTALDQPDIGIYNELCAWLGVNKIDCAIRPRTPLPKFDRKFNLVTALMLGFNTRPDGKLFTLDEWGFFLDDIRDNVLKDGGVLYLKMIRQEYREGLKISDPELQDYFRSRGADIQLAGRHVTFTASGL